MKKSLSILLLAFAVSAAYSQGTLEAISGFSQGSISGPIGSVGGWTFTPIQGIQITALGCIDSSPNYTLVSDQGPITVGLWADDGTLLASSVIYTTNDLFNQTRYVSVTPFTLSAGQTYRLGAYAPSGIINLNVIGPPPNFDGSVTLASLIQLGGSASASSGFSFPNSLGPAGTMYLGPNFTFRNLPEPSACALVAVGLFLAVLRRRSC
jgi:hypothetical protein